MPTRPLLLEVFAAGPEYLLLFRRRFTYPTHAHARALDLLLSHPEASFACITLDPSSSHIATFKRDFNTSEITSTFFYKEYACTSMKNSSASPRSETSSSSARSTANRSKSAAPRRTSTPTSSQRH
jgi:hypothetical protein